MQTYDELVQLLDRVISEMLLIQEEASRRVSKGAHRDADKVHLFPEPKGTRQAETAVLTVQPSSIPP